MEMMTIISKVSQICQFNLYRKRCRFIPAILYFQFVQHRPAVDSTACCCIRNYWAQNFCITKVHPFWSLKWYATLQVSISGWLCQSTLSFPLWW